MLPLNKLDLAMLRRLAGRLIPMDAGRGLPGADDDAIFAEILAELARAGFDAPALLGAMGKDAEGVFAGGATALAAHLRQVAGAAYVAFVSAVAFCYYRDDRVLGALGIEALPPFPRGHSIPEGDWSLLEPQHARAGFWRKAQ